MALYNYAGSEIAGYVKEQDRDYWCAFSMFPKIGVVGDSYANGYNGETDSAEDGVNHPHSSWPQMLGRRNGVSVTNYATGGLSTRTFITNSTVGLPKLTTDTAKDLYILALERNDFNYERQGHDGYIGSITDITGYSLGTYPDTFFGNYATIIETIQNHAPGAKLVMMSGDYTSSYPLGVQYNEAMEEIAEHYGIPIIKQLDDSGYFGGGNSYYRTKVGGHPTTIGYAGMELAIERLFNQCVKDNFNYFKVWWATSGTD